MVLRYRIARHAALLLGVAVTLLVTAWPAAAGTTGEFVGSAERGANVRIGGQQTKTSLLALELEDGTKLDTYCVELDVRARDGALLAESPWSEYPDAGEQFNAHPEKVLWILHNSYPNVTLGDLGDKIGVTLDAAEAIAGTQAAIWHLSNGADLDMAGDANAADVKALYAYLTGDANTGIQEQPAVSLAIAPETGTEAEVGAAAGPFTVDTTASDVELTVDGPDGVEIVDADGQPLAEVGDGTRFWLSPPAGDATGEATVRAAAKAQVEKGRLFVGVDNEENPTQTLIVAASTDTTAKAAARAVWTPGTPGTTTPTTTSVPTERPPASSTSSTAPSNAFTVPSTEAAPPQGGSLPDTGASVGQALGLAMLLLGAGIGALLLQRRRSAS